MSLQFKCMMYAIMYTYFYFYKDCGFNHNKNRKHCLFRIIKKKTNLGRPFKLINNFENKNRNALF